MRYWNTIIFVSDETHCRPTSIPTSVSWGIHVLMSLLSSSKICTLNLNDFVYYGPCARLFHTRAFHECIAWAHDRKQHVVDSTSDDYSDRHWGRIRTLPRGRISSRWIRVSYLSLAKKRHTYTSLCHYEHNALDTATILYNIVKLK